MGSVYIYIVQWVFLIYEDQYEGKHFGVTAKYYTHH